MNKFYLIEKDGEYRFSPERLTDTTIANHKRFGWIVVKSWVNRPTQAAIDSATAIDQWHTAELNRERVWAK